jgi:hypothetical protein
MLLVHKMLLFDKLATTLEPAQGFPAAAAAVDANTHHLKVIFIVFNMRVIHMLCSTSIYVYRCAHQLSCLAEVLLPESVLAQNGCRFLRTCLVQTVTCLPLYPYLVATSSDRAAARSDGNRSNGVSEDGQLVNTRKNGMSQWCSLKCSQV